MKFTINWLKDHLDTKLTDEKILDKLTNVGLEVESFQRQKSEFDQFGLLQDSGRFSHTSSAQPD